MEPLNQRLRHIVASDGSCEEWRLGHKFHREDGPAIIEYEDGKTISEKWVLNDMLHNENGPAWVEYEDGQVIREEWWIKDHYLTKENFTSLEMVNRMKAWNLFEPHELAELR